MLQAPDMWAGFTERYLEALGEAGLRDAGVQSGIWVGSGSGPGSERKYRRKRRAEALAEWHLLLLDRLDGPETAHLLDKLVAHPAIEGPERTLLAARLAQRRGDQDRARDLVREVLKELPGHQEALAFAAETGAVAAQD